MTNSNLDKQNDDGILLDAQLEWEYEAGTKVFLDLNKQKQGKKETMKSNHLDIDFSLKKYAQIVFYCFLFLKKVNVKLKKDAR